MPHVRSDRYSPESRPAASGEQGTSAQGLSRDIVQRPEGPASMTANRPSECILLVVALCFSFASSSAPTLSPRAAALIAPVHASFLLIEARQAKQDPPRSVAEQLVRLGEVDQAGRNVMQMVDLTPLRPAEREQASIIAWNEINAHDAADRAALEALLPSQGWFTIAGSGKPASDAAWSIVQHQTADPAFMRAMLKRMDGPAQRHDVDPLDYALLYDRVAMLGHQAQAYGSQFTCVDHRWTLYKLRDPQHVDDRRRVLGLSQTEEQVKARIATYPPCFFTKPKT